MAGIDVKSDLKQGSTDHYVIIKQTNLLDIIQIVGIQILQI